ncbi:MULTISPECIES: hypothetical protein [unclassified Sphingopyxis]|jgi:hypothetical protein|nr:MULTISPECIES: hypothetical protein [unclassified Sphingopyxis]MDR6834587.1 hypothetical protein [Sphingopyxis sp. BE122]MDR7226857.1 hypothetical protein [Sphingopyxis sp. BE259]
MRLQRQDGIALALFAVIAVGGLWLWTGAGPVVWLANFAILCGF